MNSKPFARIRDAFRVLEAATSVSRAVESGRRPAARDLDRLGIDAKAFDSIRF
jgi:hypothetical protein